MSWMHGRHRFVQYGLAGAFLTIGSAMVADRAFAEEAILASLGMLATFMVLLRRSHPHVVTIDAPFAVATVALLAARRLEGQFGPANRTGVAIV